MPWKVFSEDGKHCVHKLGADDSKGELVACHDSEDKAQAQMRALYASEGGSSGASENKELSEVTQEMDEKSLHDMGMGSMPVMATGFDELEQARMAEVEALELNERTSDLTAILYNILSVPDTITPRQEKISMVEVALNDYKERISMYLSDGAPDEYDDVKEIWTAAYINDLPDSAFLMVEAGGQKDADGKTTPRSLRHLPVRGKNGTPDAAHIRNAIARAPQIKLRSGQKISAATAKRLQARAQKMLRSIKKETSGLTHVVEAVRETVEKVFHKQTDAPPREDGGCMVWKEDDGSYGFLAVYSNNMLDVEDEIISSESHKHFVEMVDKGQTPLPDLQLWHIKEWTIGKATAVAYDESGFAIAVGTIFPEWNRVADWLIAHEVDLAMSHGMPASTVKYDKEDPGVIVEHVTSEISILPMWAAANKRTSFTILENPEEISKEDDMTIPTQKRDELLKMGLDAALLEQMEAKNASTAKEAGLEGIKSKEETPVVEETPAPVTEPAETPDPPAAPETPVEPPAPAVDVSNFPTREEVAEAITAVFAPVINEMKETITSLQNQVKELTDNEDERFKKLLKETPRDSLSTMITSRFSSASTSKDTVVNQGDPILRMKPKETPVPTKNKTGIPFIDQMLEPGAKE